MRPELPPATTVAVTGMNELHSGGQARQGFGVLAETLLAGAAALAVHAFVFGSAVVRALLVPALIAVLGDWNWWLPHWRPGPGGCDDRRERESDAGSTGSNHSGSFA